MSRPDEARRIAAKQDIGTIMQALKLYRLDNGRYPTQDRGLNADPEAVHRSDPEQLEGRRLSRAPAERSVG